MGMCYKRGFTLVELPAVSKRKSLAFTLVELLVVVAIIALLVSLLLPSLSRAKGSTRRVLCAGNLSHIGLGLIMYTEEHDGWYPAAEASGETPPAHVNWWQNTSLLHNFGVRPTQQQESILVCPSDENPGQFANGSPKPLWTSYAANTSCFGVARGGSRRPRRTSAVKVPSQTFAFGDACWDHDAPLVLGHQICVEGQFAFRHDGIAQILTPTREVLQFRPEDIPYDGDAPFWGNNPRYMTP